MEKRRRGDWLKGYVIVAAVYFVSLIPFRLAQVLGGLIGRLQWLLKRRAAKVSLANLGLCLPELDEAERGRLARASLIHTGRMLMETPAVWLSSNEKNLERIARVEGQELLEEQIDVGRGVVLLLPHLGNWELANAHLGAGPGMTALYLPPRIPAVRRLIERVRAGRGNQLVAPTPGGLKQLFRVLEQGGIVTVLPDQVPASGIFAPFFGVEALTDLLIPRLVRRTHATVLCIFIRRLEAGRGFEIVYRPAQPGIDAENPRAAATALNASVEACAREDLEQYQWVYKRFRKRLPGRPGLYR